MNRTVPLAPLAGMFHELVIVAPDGRLDCGWRGRGRGPTLSTVTAEAAPAQPAGIPPAEVDIDVDLVRELLRRQHPDLGGLPLRLVATGWDNMTFRLGDELAVRLPRITGGAALVVNEQTWLPVLAPTLPIAIPVPVRVGRPDAGYPWSWSVVPWLPGLSGEHGAPAPQQAGRFGAFLAAVHRPAPADAPHNDYRGVPLAALAGTVEPRLLRLAGTAACADLPHQRIWDLWHQGAEAPMDTTDTWIHGDLHPKNIVVDQGVVTAVLDWGDMTVGDRATDLAAAWMLFPTSAHPDLWAGYGEISVATMTRAVGWAVTFGAMLLETGLANDPPFAAIGRQTLLRVLGGTLPGWPTGPDRR